jgi:hypothetical protein
MSSSFALHVLYSAAAASALCMLVAALNGWLLVFDKMLLQEINHWPAWVTFK